MNECLHCGFYDQYRSGCSCPSIDKFYACPIESGFKENKAKLLELIKHFDISVKDKSTN